jgi:hypothetical protein
MDLSENEYKSQSNECRSPESEQMLRDREKTSELRKRIRVGQCQRPEQVCTAQIEIKGYINGCVPKRGNCADGKQTRRLFRINMTLRRCSSPVDPSLSGASAAFLFPSFHPGDDVRVLTGIQDAC